jgi:hypothetical protein
LRRCGSEIREAAGRLVPEALGSDTVVYAFGVGTDISFERDLIARYGVTVHAFDPTPIALEWAGSRPLPERFLLHPYGVADFGGTARFAAPRKRKFASFSLVRREGVGPRSRPRCIASPPSWTYSTCRRPT